MPYDYGDDYSRAFLLERYFIEESENQRAILLYVNECVALEAGNFNEIIAINESIVDTIKGFLKRIWEALKKQFDKFKERVTELTTTDKDFLSKYKSVIDKNPFKKHEITDFWVYKDDSLNELKIPEFKIEDMKKHMDNGNYSEADFINDYFPSFNKGDKKFNDVQDLVEFAMRGEDTEDEVNMAALDKNKIVGFVKNFDATQNALEKDNQLLGKNRLAIETAIEVFAKEVEEEEKNKTQQSSSEENKEEDNKSSQDSSDSNKQGNQNSQDSNKSGENKEDKDIEIPSSVDGGYIGNKYKHESSKIALSRVYGEYITEGNMKIKTEKESKNSALGSSKSTSGSLYNQSVKGANKEKVLKDIGKAAEFSNNNENAGKKVRNMEEATKTFYTCCTTILTTKMTINMQRYKDYMKILRIHVRDYVGEESGVTASGEVSSNNNQEGQNQNGKASISSEVKVDSFTVESNDGSGNRWRWIPIAVGGDDADAIANAITGSSKIKEEPSGTSHCGSNRAIANLNDNGKSYIAHTSRGDGVSVIVVNGKTYLTSGKNANRIRKAIEGSNEIANNKKPAILAKLGLAQQAPEAGQ